MRRHAPSGSACGPARCTEAAEHMGACRPAVRACCIRLSSAEEPPCRRGHAQAVLHLQGHLNCGEQRPGQQPRQHRCLRPALGCAPLPATSCQRPGQGHFGSARLPVPSPARSTATRAEYNWSWRRNHVLSACPVSNRVAARSCYCNFLEHAKPTRSAKITTTDPKRNSKKCKQCALMLSFFMRMQGRMN